MNRFMWSIRGKNAPKIDTKLAQWLKSKIVTITCTEQIYVIDLTKKNKRTEVKKKILNLHIDSIIKSWL